jgi:hypothetical protein
MPPMVDWHDAEMVGVFFKIVFGILIAAGIILYFYRKWS